MLLRTAALYGVATLSLAARRIGARICIYLAIGILGIVGVGFLTAAAFISLSASLGPAPSASIVGGMYLATALLILLVAKAARR